MNLKQAVMNCYDWGNVSKCDDVRAYDLAKEIAKNVPSNQNAKNLVSLTHSFMELPGSMHRPDEDTKALMNSIKQTLKFI